MTDSAAKDLAVTGKKRFSGFTLSFTADGSLMSASFFIGDHTLIPQACPEKFRSIHSLAAAFRS